MHGTLNLKRTLTLEEINLIEELARAEARENFWAFRRYLRPKMLLGWWQREVARELQKFYDSFILGQRPRCIIQSPPQHGKSEQVTDFLAWLIGKRPHLRTIFSSYSGRLGVRTNLRLQRMFASERYRNVFGDVYEPRDGYFTSRDLLKNTELIELAGGEGYFRNTTVQGAVNGESLDMGVSDDPIKGRSEANSKLVRDKTWEWLTDDFMSRFADDAAFLMILTRWHLDDPAGRLIEIDPRVRVLRYPALATENEKFRQVGDALFPELKSRDFLEAQRSVMSQSGWESEYQQNPIIVGGGMFPVDKIEVMEAQPSPKLVRRAVRYWDKAGTKDGGAYTAGVLMLLMKDKTFVVSDVRRGQWSALKRETIIKQTAQVDRATWPNYHIYVEQEPGSGGKESAESTIRNLAGFRVEADRVTGDKATRAEPYANQVEAGNVSAVAAEWNRQFIDEHESFPNGKFKDQVDAAAGSLNKLTLAVSTYDTTYSWVNGN